MAKTWCAFEDVVSRLEAVGGIGLDKIEIGKYIDRAQEEIKAKLGVVYGIDQIVSWGNSTPPLIVGLTADLAARLYLKDKAADFEDRIGNKKTYGLMDDLAGGEQKLYTAQNVEIPRLNAGLSIPPSTKTPFFTIGNEGDGTTGTLDDY